MVENKESFGDKLKQLAEVTEVIENIDIFTKENVQIKVTLEKEKYNKILRNFREVDWGADKFYINIGNISFKFVLKN